MHLEREREPKRDKRSNGERTDLFHSGDWLRKLVSVLEDCWVASRRRKVETKAQPRSSSGIVTPETPIQVPQKGGNGGESRCLQNSDFLRERGATSSAIYLRLQEPGVQPVQGLNGGPTAGDSRSHSFLPEGAPQRLGGRFVGNPR